MGRNLHHILRFLCFHFFLHSSIHFASSLCPPDQRDALLQFKNSFVLDSKASIGSCEQHGPDVSYPKTNSWNKSADCCLWDGVICDNVTSNVIDLDLSCSWLRGTLHSNSSLLLLRHLRSLNLFSNDFHGSHISPNLSALAALTHLNLSQSRFLGSVPGDISRLSRLVSLDLSGNSYEPDAYQYTSLELTSSVFTMLTQNLTSLRKLALDTVNMAMVSPKSFANLSSSLTYLSTSDCSLRGIFPDTVFRLPSLTTLDISDNYELSGILPKSNWTSPLEYLSLGSTNFTGEIPDSIGTLKSLTLLDLESCKFTGRVPSSVEDLVQLQYLNIGGNIFSGAIEFAMFTKLKNLRGLTIFSQELNLIYDAMNYTFPKLEFLGLSSCNLTRFPYFLNSLKRLISLDLSSNRISGDIPKWFWEVSHDTLELLDLYDNLLEGSIQQLPWKRLSFVDLSWNSFLGPLPILPSSIDSFDASSNDFTGEIPSSICQLSSLHFLTMYNNSLSGNMPSCFGNNKLQGPLPRSLVRCVELSELYLGHNKFSDIFPHWLEAPQLFSINLQSNKFHGTINLTEFGLSFPALQELSISNNDFTGQWPTEVFSNTSLAIIDVSNNKFGGPIPLPSPVTFYYAIASNMITGKIPSSICNFAKLETIDLSNNSLAGSLPRCITNFNAGLSILNLRMNRLEGTIPRLFSSRSSLTTLDLSQNQFEGTLPRMLVKCRYMEVLDLGNNRIEGAFPGWLGALPELKVLVLRSNNLKDHLDIPEGAHLFPKLHILDLSNNNFSGPFPSNLVTSLGGMMNGDNNQEDSLYMTPIVRAHGFRSRSYENSVTVTMKGQEMVLLKILTILTVIDLSNNSFQGNIPEAIGHLHSLVGLNLSHNHLTGLIPPALGNLTNLGWLDLSSNDLSGTIPRNLGHLASLGYLNLSKNRLTGRIPQGKQLSTFSSDSFSGNPSLCGYPLPKPCPRDAHPLPPSSSSTFDREGSESWFKQKTTWIGYASGIVIGVSISYIAFETGRPRWLMRGVRVLERRAIEWTVKPKWKAIKFHGQ